MSTSIRILIVDDHAQVRKDLSMVLQLAGGFEVVGEAADGEAAVEQAYALNPDIVLMDLEMPVSSGLEAMRLIKSRGQAKVIVLTVHAYPAAREASRKAGCDAFLVKGADINTIIKTIDQVLDKNSNQSFI